MVAALLRAGGAQAGDSEMAKQEVRKRNDRRPIVRVRPRSYQPGKAKLEEMVKIEATPDELARSILRPAKIVEDSET